MSNKCDEGVVPSFTGVVGSGSPTYSCLQVQMGLFRPCGCVVFHDPSHQTGGGKDRGKQPIRVSEEFHLHMETALCWGNPL